MEEFCKSRYGVDVLKVEVPVNPTFIAGMRAFADLGVAYSRREAIEYFRRVASVASKPFIFLSAGVSNEAFCESLELAGEARAKFSGMLCGRAIWQGGISVYANGGVEALDHWLEEYGMQNVQAINKVLARSAVPWWEVYAGLDNIEVVGAIHA